MVQYAIPVSVNKTLLRIRRPLGFLDVTTHSYMSDDVTMIHILMMTMMMIGQPLNSDEDYVGVPTCRGSDGTLLETRLLQTSNMKLSHNSITVML